MALRLGSGEVISTDVSTMLFRTSTNSINTGRFEIRSTEMYFNTSSGYPGPTWEARWVNSTTGAQLRSFSTTSSFFDIIPNTSSGGSSRILSSVNQSWNSYCVFAEQNNSYSQWNTTYLGGPGHIPLGIYMSSTEAARYGVGANYSLLIGTATEWPSGFEPLQVRSPAITTPSIRCIVGASLGSTNNNCVWFGFNAGYSGAWVTNDTTSFLAGISDYRRKTNVRDLTDGFGIISRLRPVIFNWIGDDTDADIHGFIAHEVQSVLPEAVTGEPFDVDTDGEPRYQMMDRLRVIPWLTAAVQQLVTDIEKIETQLDSLVPGA